MLGAEELAGPAPGQLLDLVDDAVAAVVPLARVALRVLVGQHRPGGGHDRPGGEILRSDELQRGVLPLLLAPDDVEELAVLGHERSLERGCLHTAPGPGTLAAVAWPHRAPARRRPPAGPARRRRGGRFAAGRRRPVARPGAGRTSPWSRRSTSGPISCPPPWPGSGPRRPARADRCGSRWGRRRPSCPTTRSCTWRSAANWRRCRRCATPSSWPRCSGPCRGRGCRT